VLDRVLPPLYYTRKYKNSDRDPWGPKDIVLKGGIYGY
jgi:hypothetical protein